MPKSIPPISPLFLDKAKTHGVTLSVKHDTHASPPDSEIWGFGSTLHAMPNSILSPVTTNRIPKTDDIIEAKRSVKGTSLAIFAVTLADGVKLVDDRQLHLYPEYENRKLVGVLAIQWGTLDSGVTFYLNDLLTYINHDFYIVSGEQAGEGIAHKRVPLHKIDCHANQIVCQFAITMPA